jgi:hypothetical protein
MIRCAFMENIVMIWTVFVWVEIILVTGPCEYLNDLAGITERF